MRKVLDKENNTKINNVRTTFGRFMFCEKTMNGKYESRIHQIIIFSLQMKLLRQIKNFPRLTLLSSKMMEEQIFFSFNLFLVFIISIKESFFQYKIFKIKKANCIDKTQLIFLLSSTFSKRFKLQIYGSLVIILTDMNNLCICFLSLSHLLTFLRCIQMFF